ncbi:NJMU protein, partial [Polypterus senegalus]|nr:NJMU protein [Polypterus senegalus]
MVFGAINIVHLTICLFSSVTLIDTNLPSQAEPDLQSHISKRLGKGTLLFGIGSTATLELRVELDGYVQELPSSLILQALRRTPVNVLGADDKTKQDIERFLNAASVHGLAQEDVSSASSCGASVVEPQKSLLIDCSQLQPTFLNEGKNRFCEEWSQAFLNSAEGGNAFLLRQILENFKLKAIQDLNNLKRLVRQAETSHYALFRCYTFLQNCGNGDVLLQNVKVEYAEMPEAGHPSSNEELQSQSRNCFLGPSVTITDAQ